MLVIIALFIILLWAGMAFVAIGSLVLLVHNLIKFARIRDTKGKHQVQFLVKSGIFVMTFIISAGLWDMATAHQCRAWKDGHGYGGPPGLRTYCEFKGVDYSFKPVIPIYDDHRIYKPK